MMITVKTWSALSRCHICCLPVFSVRLVNARLPFRSLLQFENTQDQYKVYPSRRHLSSSCIQKSDVVEREPDPDDLIQNRNPSSPESTAFPEENNSQLPEKPWYLQVENPFQSQKPLLERQQLPDLPDNPPPLLQPILEHIFTDLGLDDLLIFDLRNLDPPPALGANLLMILGTARSEKHLHVSADRFCRWLKVAHKLSPYADGLLGKGELKLKLRRKARRARLLSNVGSSGAGNPDDGIRTGWICVNIGTIEDANISREEYAPLSGHVGFGDEAGGAKLVVQMLTQEKREELDLEDLWGKTLKRQQRKEERITPTEAAIP